MRILLINNYFSNTGGADVYTYRVGQLLRENGHEVFFFATDQKPYFEDNYEYSSYFPRNIDYKSLSKLELIKHNFRPFYNFEAEAKLDKFIKLIKPDLIHCNCIFFNLTPSVLNAAYKNNIPVAMTLHGPQLMCPSVKMMYKSEVYCKDKYCVSGNPIHCITNKCLNKSYIKSIGITTEFIFRKIHGLYSKISAYICPSQAILDLAQMSGIDSNRLFLINNFVDRSLFTNEVQDSNRGYFLFVGRLSKEKGAHYLIEAMTKLPKDIKVHIVGTGQEEENLKLQAKQHNLSNIEFMGFKSGKELEEEYKNCRGTIIPCDWFENFPTTVIESFTYGKPVIGSRIGGIPEMIDDNINGLIFETGNTDQLSQAIYKLYSNNNLVQEMGNQGRLKAHRHYTPEVYYTKLIKVYNNCTSGECTIS